MNKKKERIKTARKIRKFIKEKIGLKISLPISIGIAEAIENKDLVSYLIDKNLMQLYDVLYKVKLDKYEYWDYRLTDIGKELYKMIEKIKKEVENGNERDY